MTVGWIVAVSKPCREAYAAENLARQNTTYYFPRIVETVTRGPRRQRQTIERAVPLFPRYIFVHIHDQWRFVLNTFGIAGIIMRGEEPHFCPQRAIDQMLARQDDTGMVQLPKPDTSLQPGDHVKLTHGRFSGHTGIYQGMAAKDRQRVLLDFLGRKTQVLISKGGLQLIERSLAA